MREIRHSTNEELSWLCQELEIHPTSAMRGLTLLVDDTPVLMVGYDNWTEGAVSMHQWAVHPKYFGRDILREAFRYPFGIGNKSVAVATVRSDNPRALEVDRKIGFKDIAVIPDAYGPGVNMHILTLYRHSCRWYRHDDSRSLVSRCSDAPVGPDGAAECDAGAAAG